jgi:hypothetical protein
VITENNPLITAKRLGRSIGGSLGARAYEELELAFCTRLFPKKFANVPTLRTRQHILLYWRKGFLKTTFLREFAKTIPSQFEVANLSALTTETLVGSATNPKSSSEKPKIIAPIISGLDFALIAEHSALLRHGGPMESKIAILNDILEGDVVTNNLIKLSHVWPDAEQEKEFAELGIQLDPDRGMIRYRPDVIVFSCSHPFDQRMLNLLVDTGHFDRFRVVQERITPEIARECFDTEFSLDRMAQERLRKHNEALACARIDSVETPPHSKIKALNDLIFSLARVPDFRLFGDIIRTVSSHMLLRLYSQGILQNQYMQTNYSDDDFDYVADKLDDFVEPRLHPLVANDFATIKRGRIRDDVKDIVVGFLENAVLSDVDGEALASINSTVVSKMPRVHFQTINNAIGELLKENVIERVPNRRGFYRICLKEEN